jgi:hypothetical protein
MTTTTILNLPLSTRFNNGQFTGATRAVPAGFQVLTVTLNPTTGNPATPFQGIANPFNNPATVAVFGIKWSWDGGSTFPESVQRTESGSPTGQWAGAKGDTMSPWFALSIPFNTNLGGLPNAYQPYASLSGGPINSGLVVTETTTP